MAVQINSEKSRNSAFRRDHSTVVYSLEQIEMRTVEQPQLRYELEALASRLGPEGLGTKRLRPLRT